MSTFRIGCNHEMVYNYKAREYGGAQQQPWQVGITILPSEMVNQQEQEDQQQHQMTSYRQETPSCSKTIMEQIGSPSSALLATERYLGFSQNGVQRSFNEDNDVSSPQMRFDRFVQPREDGYFSSFDRSFKMRFGNPSEKDQIRELKRKLLDENDVSEWRQSQSSICYDGNLDIGVKATPKAILKLMDSDGLTIFHVKSHLQKYRIAKYLPENAKGNMEKRTNIDTISQIENITGMQFKDALQMQLAVQRQLHEQLEIQRNLQLRIEEQAKQLKKMFDQHKQQKPNKSQNSEITTSYDDHHSTNLDGDEILNLEDDSENTLFPSKIS
ncbi:Myb domain [Tanacetum coccineum]